LNSFCRVTFLSIRKYKRAADASRGPLSSQRFAGVATLTSAALVAMALSAVRRRVRPFPAIQTTRLADLFRTDADGSRNKPVADAVFRRDDASVV